MKNYTCPMHPEIKSTKPGRCPKCGMKLVLVNEVTDHQSPDPNDKGLGKITWKSYLPLIVIVGLILITTFIISLKDSMSGNFATAKTISYFMSGFFIVFAGFKLIDLKGFAEGYSTYDLLAQKWFPYGYIYPFIELTFGLKMIADPQNKFLLMAELLVMSFSGLGVAIKIAKREKFQCACLGTFLKVPLTKVTLVEDFGMATLALLLLLIR